MTKNDKIEKKSEGDEPFGFDMYRFFSRWDVIFVVAFIIAFLIFTMAVFLNPQAV